MLFILFFSPLNAIEWTAFCLYSVCTRKQSTILCVFIGVSLSLLIRLLFWGGVNGNEKKGHV